MTSEKWQNQEAINEGLPPVMNKRPTTTRRSARSTRSPTCCATSSRTPVTRPQTPSYSDVTLAIQDTLHPPAVDQPAEVDQHADVTA